MSDVTPKPPAMPAALVALSGPRKNVPAAQSELTRLQRERPEDSTQVVPEPAVYTNAVVQDSAPARPELVLYVGCTPVIGPHVTQVQSIEVVLAPYLDAVCGQYGVKDIRLIKYSEGYGALAALLRDQPPTGHITMDRMGALSNAALEALLPLATAVIRATA